MHDSLLNLLNCNFLYEHVNDPVSAESGLDSITCIDFFQNYEGWWIMMTMMTFIRHKGKSKATYNKCNVDIETVAHR